MASPLDNVSIVLVDTKTPANIGSVARCMMNMSLSRLVLVRPPEDRLGEAVKLAAGAEKILGAAERYPSLKEALADQSLAFGVSRHPGRLRKNSNTPRALASKIAPYLLNGTVSLVFGNEVNGLQKSDLALCDEFVSIPSSEAFPSLNLSHAVMVLAYEFFLACADRPAPVDRELARKASLENFYDHLQTTLQHIGFLGLDEPERMMFSLRQIFGRARLDEREVRILRGILNKIGKDQQK